MTDQLSTSVKVPAFAIPALLGKNGNKVKDIERTAGARINIDRTGQWAQVTISGTSSAITRASLLVKMAVLHARAADHTPDPSTYTKDRKAEAQLDMFTFYSETEARAFNTKYPETKS